MDSSQTNIYAQFSSDFYFMDSSQRNIFLPTKVWFLLDFVQINNKQFYQKCQKMFLNPLTNKFENHL